MRLGEMLQAYALKRLVRGLGSGHDAARQGFGLALSAALAKVPEIESLPALDMLDAALEVGKSTKVKRRNKTHSKSLHAKAFCALKGSHMQLINGDLISLRFGETSGSYQG